MVDTPEDDMTDEAFIMALILTPIMIGLLILLGGRRRPRRRDDSMSIDPKDIKDVSSRFRFITRQQRRTGRKPPTLIGRLEGLVGARVQVESLQRLDSDRMRIVFADGTEIVVRTEEEEAIRQLLDAATQSELHLSRCGSGPESIEVAFDSPHGRIFTILVGMKRAERE